MPGNRYSVVSSSETYNSGLGNEANPLFRQSQSFVSMSQYGNLSPEAKLVEPASSSQLALPQTRGLPGMGRDPSPSSTESGSAGRLERGPSDGPSSFTHSGVSHSPYRAYNETYYDDSDQPILRPSLPVGSFTSSPEPAYTQPVGPVFVEPEVLSPTGQPSGMSTHSSHGSHGRGVSLVDTGPVPVGGQIAPHDPVRRVSRHQQRPSSSRNQFLSPVSSSSHSSTLPPGAVSDVMC